MNILELFVWILLSSFTLLALVMWLAKKRQYRYGRIYDTREVVALYTVPRVVIAWTLTLIAFLFADVSKFYLLLIFPCVYIFINLRMAKRVLKEDEERFKAEIAKMK